MNFKNHNNSDDNFNMEKQGGDKDVLDPLRKLKKERELLIQWSKKLKNNNSSFLNTDKLDIEEHNEKVYSSDNSLNEKKKKNEENYYITESDNNDKLSNNYQNNDNNKKNIQIYLNDDHFDKKLSKNNINFVYTNKKKPIKIVRKKNDISNSINLKNIDHGNDIGINKNDGQNYIGKFYNENILHKNIKNEHSFSDSSNGMSENLSEIVDHNKSYENRNINEYKTIDTYDSNSNIQINYQNKKKNRIEYKNDDILNYYEHSNNSKIVQNKGKNKSDEENEDNNSRWKENNYRYNIENYSGDKKEINKKKIKLTRRAIGP